MAKEWTAEWWSTNTVGTSPAWANPERVEAGQVWDPGAWRELVIVNSLKEQGRLASFAYSGDLASVSLMLKDWRCIGYQLDDGRRVMVGDRYAIVATRTQWEIAAVDTAGSVWRRCCEPRQDGGYTSEVVPAWSMLDGFWTKVDMLGGVDPVFHAAIDGIDADRWRREAPRVEIDKMLAEDARLHPAFATARKAAVMAACEREERTPVSLSGLLLALRLYEDQRGGGRRPPNMWVSERDRMALDVYERARGCR